MEIFKTLSKIQVGLKAPKAQYNEYGKYKYRSLEDIMEALKPLLAEHEACIVCEDSIVNIGDRIYVEAIATLYCGEEQIQTKAYAREALVRKGQDESQITGSASSYARKFALNGLFAIDDTKDADATNNNETTKIPHETYVKWQEALDKNKTIEEIKSWWLKNKEVAKKELGLKGASELYQQLQDSIKHLESKL